MGKKHIQDHATPIVTERDKELQDGLLLPCHDKEQLRMWFKIYLNVDLADCTVSRFATTNPMDAAWEIYQHALFNLSDEPLNILLVASRASQKTLSMAAVELAVMLHDRRDILHYAAAENQAKVGWAYLLKFVQKPFIRDYLETKPTNDNVIFKLPNILDPTEEPRIVTGKVLSITALNAQGQHASFMSVDELLTLAHDKRKAYYDLAGVPVSTDMGRPYIRAEISSRKGPYSVVEEKIQEKEKTGLTVKTWTVFENQKRCPDERSGVIPTEFYGNPKTGVLLTTEQYKELSHAEQSGFYKGKGFDKCLQCKIASFCLGDAKKQTSDCRILNPVEKTITDYHNTTLDLWSSQRMSLEPSKAGLVFPTFSKERHIKTLKEIWEIYTGKSIDFVPSYAKLIELMHKDKCVFWAGLDHSGGSSPCAIDTVAVDARGRVFLLNVYEEVVGIDTLEEKLEQLNSLYKYRTIFPDPAAKDKNDILRKKFRIKDKFTKDVSLGFDLIRRKIMSADGTISFYVLSEGTVSFQNEIAKYHYKELPDGKFSDVPVDENDHSIDALRYVFQNIFTKTNGEWVISIDNTRYDDEPEYLEDPTAQLNVWFKNHVNAMLEEKVVQEGGGMIKQDGYLFFDL